jgi:hypothetical protein
MSISQAGTLGGAGRFSIVVAAGGRAVYAHPIAERFALRGIFDIEGLLQPFSLSDDAGHHPSTPSPVSLTWGIGFGGSL